MDATMIDQPKVEGGVHTLSARGRVTLQPDSRGAPLTASFRPNADDQDRSVCAAAKNADNVGAISTTPSARMRSPSVPMSW